jgi:large repetitive protein
LCFALPSVVFAQDRVTKSLTLTVNPRAVSVTPTQIPNGMVGLAYHTTVAATGGLAPYAFSVSTGTLPAGVTIASGTGVLSGAPTTAGTSTFTVKVSDAEVPAVTAVQSYSVTVFPTLAITTASLPAVNIGVAYTTTLTATGGVAPYKFTVTTGTLPAGLTLNSTTGVLSGTPSAAGSFAFTITVTDSATNVVRLEIKTTIEIVAVVGKNNQS